MTKQSLDDVLAHHGVKGMKWGVRRSDAQLARAGGSSKSEKVSRKAYKAQVKQESSDFYQNKAHDLLKQSMNDPDLLVKLHAGGVPVVITGKQFVEHLSNGGVMDVKATDIYAKQETKDGLYVLRGPSRVYKAPGRSTPAKLTAPSHFSNASKEVIADYNKLSSSDFYNRYHVSKEQYSKAVAKGDPNPNGERQ